MRILIAGASGQLGTLISNELLKLYPKEKIVLSTRTPDKLTKFKDLGIDVRYANYDEESSLKDALKGIDHALLISVGGNDDQLRMKQHQAFIDAAKHANIKKIIYTSVTKADLALIPFFKVHQVTEQAIKDSGIPYAFVRNNWYLENELDKLNEWLHGKPLNDASEGGRIGWALRREYAKAIANLLVKHQTVVNKTYELSGQPKTSFELTQAFKKATNVDVEYNETTAQAMEGMLTTFGFPAEIAKLLTDIQRGIKNGALDVESADLEDLLEEPVLSLDKAIKELLNQ